MSHQRYSVQSTPKAWARVYNKSPKTIEFDLEKFAIQLANGASIQEIESLDARIIAVKPIKKETTAEEIPDKEPIIKHAKEIVLQIWVKNETTRTLESRFIVCSLPRQQEDISIITNPNILIYDHAFGNVDLILSSAVKT